MNQVRIIHLASLARSGETLMLRVLGAHPSIFPVYQLQQQETPEELALFTHIKHSADTYIAANSSLLTHLKLPPEASLLMKQGIWEHKFPFDGFVLVRNPASVYASLEQYDRQLRAPRGVVHWLAARVLNRSGRDNRERILRWMGDMAPTLVPSLAECTALERFAAFYNYRMLHLKQLGLPVVHYERLVENPKGVLEALLSALRIPFDPGILDSHLRFSGDDTGHGENDLTQPISTASLNKYRQLNRSVFERVRALTAPTWQAYGYQLDWDNISVKPDALIA